MNVLEDSQLMLGWNVKLKEWSNEKLFGTKVGHKNTIFSAIFPVKYRGAVNSETISPLKLILGHSYLYPMPIKWYKFQVKWPTPIFSLCPVFSDNDS